MINPVPADENEMIAAFLREEVDLSSHWSDCVKKGLAAIGAARSLIDEPNLKDPAENCSRRDVLDSYRGYKGRQGQFAGFPAEVTWRLVDLEPEDFRTMQYMDHPNWNQLSSGNRLVSEGARNLPRFASDQRFQHIIAIAEAIRAGERFEPLIAAQHHEGHLVLIEGHSRATAYALVSFTGRVKAFVGSSPSMYKWERY